MNFESLPKYYSPKSPKLNDEAVATSSEALTITDVMAAQGMTQNRAKFGFSAFLGKMGISRNDREAAIGLLTKYALSRCDEVAALRKLDPSLKPGVMQILATYAFEDYSRSASSKKICPCCHGKKFISVSVFTNKVQYPDGKPPKWVKVTSGVYPSYWEEWKSVQETQKVICPECKGKGEVSAACNDCHGRGKAVKKKMSEEQGVPVIGNCERCGGRGYERIPSTEAYKAICEITDAISLDTWKKSVKKFYSDLIAKFEAEESWAEQQLISVTR
ncbi:antitermination protein [Salmonella enterica]|nr:antitermination protein [Salmonella enterica]